MTWRRLLRRIASPFAARRLDAELAEEIAAHLALEEEANRAAGMSAAAARAAARRRFGNPTRTREDTRQAWTVRWFEALVQDVRYALRVLRKSPGFTLVAVATLALGIGANTAIFTLLDQILLRTLPVADPRALVGLTMRGAHYGSNSGPNSLSYPMFRDLAARNAAFTGMFARRSSTLTVSFDGRAERTPAELISGRYFEVLGVGTALGRTITPADDVEHAPEPVAVLSHAYWRSSFGADPAVLGRKLLVNNRPLTVIGVAAPGFDGVELGHQARLFVPVTLQPALGVSSPKNLLADRRWRWVNVFARLRPGVGVAEAQASLQPLMRAMLEREVKEPAFSQASAGTREGFLRCWIEVSPAAYGRSPMRQRLAQPLWVLMAAAGFVLLIACANLANLVLARGAVRQRELSVRLALGARRGRLVMQLLIESLVLATLGSVMALLIAEAGAGALLGFIGGDAGTSTLATAPDLRVLAFTSGLTVLTTVGFGLLPALDATRGALAGRLRAGAGAVLGGHTQLRKGLSVVQVALSLVLLVGAGLFLRSLHNLRQLGPGFPTERLISFSIDPAVSGYDTPRAKAFYLRLSEDLAAVPGVRQVALAAMRILGGSSWTGSVTIEGYTAAPGQPSSPYAFMNIVSPGYFATLGVPLVAGRDFTVDDRQDLRRTIGDDQWTPTVAIVNEAFVRRYLPGRNPVGVRIGFGGDPNTPMEMEIIGVARDSKYESLRQDTPEQAFFPYLGSHTIRGMTVYLRTAADPDTVMAAVRGRVAALDANLPIYGLGTMASQLDDSLSNERLIASLTSIFGLLAATLAMIGLYGVMAYNVARRTREIGIRIALGAWRPAVVGMVMREVLLLIVLGLGLGVALALALARVVQSQLYGLPAHDLPTLALACLALFAVAALAGYLPARRASRLDPMVALRQD